MFRVLFYVLSVVFVSSTLLATSLPTGYELRLGAGFLRENSLVFSEEKVKRLVEGLISIYLGPQYFVPLDPFLKRISKYYRESDYQLSGDSDRSSPIKVIADGSFGEIILAEYQGRGIVAIKVVLDLNLERASFEGRLLGRLRPHPSIVKYYGQDLCLNSDKRYRICLCMEKMDCDLGWLARSSSYFGDRNKYFSKKFITQILKGLAYLHSQGILHQDLKPNNILVNFFDKRVKICDFGNARIMSPDEIASGAKFKFKGIAMLTGYCPKEIAEQKDFGFNAETWGAGAIYVFMRQGKKLFEHTSIPSHLTRIDAVIPNNLAENINPQLRKRGEAPLESDPLEHAFIKELLKKDPDQRPSADQALKHPFLRGAD